MKGLFFWKNWTLNERIIASLSILVILASAIAALWVFWQGENNVFKWTAEGELTRIPLQIDSFEKGLFPFIAEVDGFLMSKTFSTSWLQINYSIANLFALLIAFGWVCALTAATYLKPLWYGCVMLIFAIFLSFCNIDGLTGVQGLMEWQSEKKWFLVVLAAYGILTFSLQMLGKGSVLMRFLLLTALTVGLSYYLKIEVNQLAEPVFFLSNYGIVVPIGLTILFLIFNGQEIPRALFWLVSRSGDGRSSTLIHFIVVSAVFFLHMVYVYLISTKWLDWGIIYVPAFVLFALMIVLGFWGFVGRENHYRNLFKAQPVGLLLYTGWALVSIATVIFTVGTQNDTLIRMLERVVIYVNIGFTFAFFIYVFTNFSELLEQGIHAHKVLWEPRKMSWSFAGLAAAFVIVILFYKDNGQYFYSQMQSAYYNGIGDTYLAEGDAMKAANTENDETVEQIVQETYQLAGIEYKKAVQKIYTNHKGYWGLGSIALRNYRWQEAYSYLKIASERTASPYTFAKVAELLLRKNEANHAYSTLLNGAAEFPESAELQNNMILYFVEQYGVDYNDSLANILQKVEPRAALPEVIETNWWTLRTLSDSQSPTDSLEQQIKTRDNTGTLSNKLLYQKRFDNQSIDFFDTSLLKDSVWTTEDLLYAYHYALIRPSKGDSSLVSLFKEREQVLENQQNIAFILLAKAVEEYHLGDVYSAFRTLQYLEKAYGNQSAQYKHLLGLWLLEHEQYDQAERYFEKAYLSNRGLNNLYQAISLSELKDKTQALEMWRGWDTTQNHPFQPTANEMYCILRPECAKILNFEELDENAKRRYLHYQIPYLSQEGFADKLRLMKDQNLKLEVVLDKIEHLLAEANLKEALVWRNSATQLNAENLKPSTVERFQLIDLELLWKDNKLLSAKSILENLNPSRAYGRAQKDFYTALYAEIVGDSARANYLMQKAISGLPFDISFVQEGIAFYKRQNAPEKAYETAYRLLETYPQVPKVHFLYAFEALEMGLEEDAERSKEFIRLNAPQTYESFAPLYKELKAKKQQELEEWMNGSIE